MWGEGGYPPHPYLVEPGRPGSVPMYGAEAEAARQAREAATVLGSGLVEQRLREAERFGERQAQEAAHMAAAEAHFVMDQQRRAAMAATAPRTAIPAGGVAVPSRPAQISRTAVVRPSVESSVSETTQPYVPIALQRQRSEAEYIYPVPRKERNGNRVFWVAAISWVIVTLILVIMANNGVISQDFINPIVLVPIFWLFGEFIDFVIRS